MAVPFAMRWEVSSLRSHHGSFVEAARVKPLAEAVPGEWWVERLVPDLKPAHVARVQRRWWLAARVGSLAWPQLIDAGDESGQPWAVVQPPGRRSDGTFPFADSQLALRGARGLALGVAEVEQLLAAHGTSPHLSIRPSLLACDDAGRLRFHLAALDAEPDQGFPTTPATWMWTAEELLGVPQTARSNVFALGWLLSLLLTGRSPYGPVAAGASEKTAKETLRKLVLGNSFSFGLPPLLKPVEPILKRALAWPPAQRFPDSQAFADALETLAPGTPQRRTPGAPPPIPAPMFEPRFEQLPAALETRLAQSSDDSPLWPELGQLLADVHSPRAKLMRGDESVIPELAPTLAGERFTMSWKQGYVRTLTVDPEARVENSELRVWELVGLLQHPSLRFLTDLTLTGPLDHARPWLEALQRSSPLALKRVTVHAVPANDPIAVDIAFRFPRWTWTWGGATPAPGFFSRWFGR